MAKRALSLTTHLRAMRSLRPGLQRIPARLLLLSKCIAVPAISSGKTMSSSALTGSPFA